METKDTRINVVVEAASPEEAQRIVERRLTGGSYGCINYMFWETSREAGNSWRVKGKAVCTDASDIITSLDS